MVMEMKKNEEIQVILDNEYCRMQWPIGCWNEDVRRRLNGLLGFRDTYEWSGIGVGGKRCYIVSFDNY